MKQDRHKQYKSCHNHPAPQQQQQRQKKKQQLNTWPSYGLRGQPPLGQQI